MQINEKALEAAIVAVESMGCVHFGAEIEAAIRAYLTSATPPDVVGLVERLEKRAKEDDNCAANSRVVADLLSPELAKFNDRDEVGWNTYAVRMAVDHRSSMERDRRYADDLREAATALRLSAGGGVPVGWKLVPVEPTPEMIGAFWRQKNCGTQEVGDRGPHTDDYSAYRAMLAASPTVEAGHVE